MPLISSKVPLYMGPCSVVPHPHMCVQPIQSKRYNPTSIDGGEIYDHLDRIIFSWNQSYTHFISYA